MQTYVPYGFLVPSPSRTPGAVCLVGIGARVEGEPMPGDPIARVHANGRNLLLSRPNAGVLRNTLGRDSELAERPNEQFLDLAEIPVKILLVAFEIDDRIAD